MPRLFAFSVVEGALPTTTFVSADAEVFFGPEKLAGRVFLAEHRGGEVAAAVELADSRTLGIDLAKLARQDQLAASVVIAEENGISIVTGIRLHHATQKPASAWVDGAPYDHLSDFCRSWFGAVVVARMRADCSRALHVPPITARPAGEGEPLMLTVAGEIGGGRYRGDEIAGQIGEAHGRSIILTIDSNGGDCEDGLEIYRALAAHPNAVHARIRRAESMSTIVGLAADHREITADGCMLLHRPHIPRANCEADDLRRLADRLDGLTDQFAGIVAARTRQPRDIALTWIESGFRFTAGEAVRAGLCHRIDRDTIALAPRAVRARFRPINGPYGAVRPAVVQLFAYGGRPIRAGETRRHDGHLWVANRGTIAAPGLEPGRCVEWDLVQ